MRRTAFLAALAAAPIAAPLAAKIAPKPATSVEVVELYVRRLWEDETRQIVAQLRLYGRTYIVNGRAVFRKEIEI